MAENHRKVTAALGEDLATMRAEVDDHMQRSARQIERFLMARMRASTPTSTATLQEP